MADEQMPDAPPGQGTIRYGGITMDKGGFAHGMDKGNINVAHAAGPAETLELTDASKVSREQQSELLQQAELRRRMRELVVPTNDAEVRKMLRAAGEPMTLFGEREGERRDRLRKLLATDEEVQMKLAEAAEDQYFVEEVIRPKEKFYTEGPEQLKDARYKIAQHSLARACERLAAAKRRRLDPDEDEEAERTAVLRQVQRTVQQVSEIGDERPISDCAFSPDGTVLATCGWGGALRLWDMPSCSKRLSVKPQADRGTGVAWHPHARLEGGSVALAIGCVDSKARLLSADGQVLSTLEGHADRLARCAFHPLGLHLGTASFDLTWRLWDMATGACLQEQEGHSRAVYCLAFQGDGALAVSGGLDAVGRVWDMRTGRCVVTLEGHVKGVLAADWSPNGYQVATGSDDHTARVWDIRQRKCVYTLPGHTSLVSQVRFEPTDGHFLMTSGYDNTSKLWSASDFSLLRTLAGHEGKVMGCDVSPDGSGLLASVSYDRTIKLWAPDLFEDEDYGGRDEQMAGEGLMQ